MVYICVYIYLFIFFSLVLKSNLEYFVHIKWVVSVTAMRCVFLEVGTESLNTVNMSFILYMFNDLILF